jgi:hypothetical protein
MRINRLLIILFSAFAILFIGTVSAESADQITNPTLKDLQGHWHGFTNVPKYRISTTCYYTFAGDKATYSSERGGYKAKVTLKGEEININTADGKISETCKLSKESDTLVLKCSFDVAKYGVKEAYDGTRRLEKDK